MDTCCIFRLLVCLPRNHVGSYLHIKLGNREKSQVYLPAVTAICDVIGQATSGGNCNCTSAECGRYTVLQNLVSQIRLQMNDLNLMVDKLKSVWTWRFSFSINFSSETQTNTECLKVSNGYNKQGCKSLVSSRYDIKSSHWTTIRYLPITKVCCDMIWIRFYSGACNQYLIIIPQGWMCYEVIGHEGDKIQLVGQ